MPLAPEAGGTERITSLISKGLRARGHDCMSILQFSKHGSAPIYEGEQISDVYAFLINNHVDVVINQIGNSTWLLKDFLTRGGDKWHKEGGKIITCLHFNPDGQSDFYLNLSKRNKKLRDYIDIIKTCVLYNYYKKRHIIAAGDIFNTLYDDSDYFLTLSESFFPYMKKAMKRENYSKLLAINNPLTFDGISTADSLNEKEKIVLVCSRMDENQKRISLILKAWYNIEKSKVSNDWRLIILGDGGDLNHYKDVATKLKLKRCYFEGHKNPEPYYERASIFLMTSKFEGWGLTLTESLQKGVVPVVMNTMPVFSDIITTGYNGYLTRKNDLRAFSHSVLTLIDNPGKLKEMQLNALKSASKFSLDSTIEKWLRLL